MKLILSEKEKKELKKLQYVGDQQGAKVYSNMHERLMQADLRLSCNCGLKFCIHKKMLLAKLFMEQKVYDGVR
jgi:hypothetical protein